MASLARMRFALTTAVLVGLIGCVGPPSVTRQIDDPPRMVEVILAHVPAGTPIGDAQRFMEREGFKCSRETNALVPGRETDYLFCDRYDSVGWWVAQRWHVSIAHRDGKVAEVEASTGLIAP